MDPLSIAHLIIFHEFNHQFPRLFVIVTLIHLRIFNRSAQGFQEPEVFIRFTF